MKTFNCKYRFGLGDLLDPEKREDYVVQYLLSEMINLDQRVWFVDPTQKVRMFNWIQMMLRGDFVAILEADYKEQLKHFKNGFNKRASFSRKESDFSVYIRIIKKNRKLRLRAAKPNQRRRGIG